MHYLATRVIWLTFGALCLSCASGPGEPTSVVDPSDGGSGPTNDAQAQEVAPSAEGAAEATTTDGSPQDVPPPDAGAQDAETGHKWPPSSYTGKYEGVDALAGQDLVNRLCQLVQDGYQTMSYTAARQMVLKHEDNHNGEIRTVYEGLWHAATDTTLNIEHTWPQSKGAVGVAKSDLHHLFPEAGNFNSARSNYPFGTVAVRDWPATLTGDSACTDHPIDHSTGCFSKKGKDAFGVEVWEPRDGHKGDAARAVFYFSIRYGNACQVRPLSDFDATHPKVTEDILKHWNYADAPDDHERRRNDLVEVDQKVRNPFIDHPELVDRVDFQ